MNSIGPRIAIAGEREYRQAMRQLSIDTKLLTSETQKSAAAFIGSEKSMESLRGKSAQLESQMSGYSTMVETARQGLEKSQKNSADYAKAIEDLKNKLSSAQSALDKMKSSSDTTDKELKEQEKTVKDLTTDLNNAEKSYERVNTTTKQWETSLNRNEASLKTAQKQLEANEKAIEDYGKAQIEAAKNSEEHKKAAENLKKTMDTVKIAVAAVTAAIVFSGKAAIDYESAFAGVTKTVDATKEELQGLSDGIREMAQDIPVAANDIAEIAENAGQLGIETDNILGFTRVIADLGVATNLTGKEAAQTLAKFANITQMPQEQFSNLGSAIVDLGNNFATTEKDIAAMAMRLAGAGTQAGLTEAEILAMATALSSVGVEAEAGGSAFSKVFTKMNVAVQTNAGILQDYAKVAGMTAEQFKSTFQSNAAEAVIGFVEGLGKAGKESVVILEDMELNEVRLQRALLSTASAEDTMRSAIETANTAWEENTALTTEAEQRYATTASQIQMLKNNIYEAAIQVGEGLLPQIKDLSEKIKDADLQPIVKSLQWIIDNSKVIISGVVGIGAGMVTWNVANTIMSVVKAMQVWKGAMDAARVSQLGLNAAMASNPIGLVVTVLATLTAGLVTYGVVAGQAKSAAEEFHDEIKDLGEEIDTLKGKTEDLTTTFDVQADEAKALTNELYNLEAQLQDTNLTEEKTEEIKGRMHDIMRQLRNIVPELVIELNNETKQLSVQRGEVENLIDSYIRLAKAKAAQKLLEEAEEKTLRARVQLKKAEESRAGAQWNIDYLGGRLTPSDSVTPAEANANRQLFQTETKAVKEWSESLKDSGDNVHNLEKETESLKKAIEESGIDFAAASKDLEKLEENLDDASTNTAKNISTGAKTASKATKDASKEIQDEFNKRQRNLKFNLDMGHITEQRYYEGLELLRDEYFDEGTDEWQRYALEIYNYQKKTFENVKKDLEDTFAEITNSMKAETDEVARLKSNLENKLQSESSLFQTVRITSGEGTVEFKKLNDFSHILEKYSKYADLLEKVKDRGISRVMFNEIMNLSIDDGIEFMQLLINATDDDFDSYKAAHNAVDTISRSLPDYVYREETQAIADKYTDEFQKAFEGLQTEYFDIGSMYAQAMGEGFTEQFAYVFAEMKDDIENKLKSLNAGFNLQRYNTAQAANGGSYTFAPVYNLSSGTTMTQASADARRTAAIERLKGIR